MNKLSVVVAAVCLVAACKDSKKTAPKTTEPARGSAALDTTWVERLPEVDDPMALSLGMTSGLVGIKEDGSLHVARPPAAGAPPLGESTAVSLDKLVAELGISPVVPRTDDAFATVESADPAAAKDPLSALAHPSRVSGAPAPAKRATSVFAIAHPHPVTAGVIVFADARARAAVLVDVLAKTGGFLAVRKGKELGALPLAFDRQGPPAVAPDRSWLEIRMGKTIEVEKVPAKPVMIESVDKLAEAVTGATSVDLLVGDDTTVADLVTVVGKLRGAKIEAIALGHVPTDLVGRGEQGPRVLAWDFQQKGQGEAAGIRAAFDAALEPIRACYAKALEKTHDLAGTAQIEWFVSEKGKVDKLAVVGIPPVLVQCVTSTIKSSKYPAAGAAGVVLDARLAFVK